MKILPTLIFLLILSPTLALAAGPAQYQPLVDLFASANTDDNFNGFINGLYVISISIAALLAVIKIVIAGVKWMLSDVVTSKSEAKKDITGALIGLLVVLSAVLILTIINPDIVKNDVVISPTPIMVGSGSGGSSAPTGTRVIACIIRQSEYDCDTATNNCIAAGGTYEIAPDRSTLSCTR